MNMNSILPSAAESLICEAEKKRQNVYIFGMCGYGKSTFVQNYLKASAYLYFDMLIEPEKLLESDIKKKTTLVIDNLGFLEDDTVKDKIIHFLNNPLCWCILISRAHCPEWLISRNGHFGNFTIISESDLAFSYDETLKLLELNNVKNPSESVALHLHQYSHGHPLFIKYASSRISSEKNIDNASSINSSDTSLILLNQVSLSSFSSYTSIYLLRIVLISSISVISCHS